MESNGFNVKNSWNLFNFDSGCRTIAATYMYNPDLPTFCVHLLSTNPEIIHGTVHSSFAWPLYFKEEFLSLHYQRIVNPQKCHEQKTHCLVIFSQFVCISKVFRTHYFSSMIRRTSFICLWFKYFSLSNWNHLRYKQMHIANNSCYKYMTNWLINFWLWIL